MRILTLCLALLATPALATPDLTGATWMVEGSDSGVSWNGSTIVFECQATGEDGDTEVSGYIDWISDRGHSGREIFAGTFFANGTFDYAGSEMQFTKRLITVRYTGVMDGDDRFIGSWSMGVPGDFTATRDASRIPTVREDFSTCFGQALSS